jgi:hypothetical protein
LEHEEAKKKKIFVLRVFVLSSDFVIAVVAYGCCKVSSSAAANARRFTVGLTSEALRAFSGRFSGLCCLALRFSAGRLRLSSDFATAISSPPE